MKRGFLNTSKAKKEPLYPEPGASDAAAAVPATDNSSNSVEHPTYICQKLPYGKVETAALPTEYKHAELSFLDANAVKTNSAADVIVMATIPSREIHGPLDPDGHSEWMVYGETIAQVLDAPGYPQPVPKPPGPPPFVVKSTPNMGIGMFASRDIQINGLIFAERPLLVKPRHLPLKKSTIDFLMGCDFKTLRTVTMFEWEKQVEVVVGRMTPENQDAFRALANSHQENGNGSLLGILRTNTYAIELFDGETEHPQGLNGYSALGNLGSRINHSCMPNVIHSFDLASFSLQFTAWRDIKAGEQLFSSYCDIDQSVVERQAALAPYGFVCKCPACVHATPETDRLRKEYEKLTKYHLDKFIQWTLAPRLSLAENEINPMLEFRKAMIEEGLVITNDYKAIVHLIQQFYEGLGLYEKARPFKQEHSKYWLDGRGL